jgi:hypothetical protein
MVSKNTECVQDRADAAIITDHDVKFLFVPFHFKIVLILVIRAFIQKPNPKHRFVFAGVYHMVVFKNIAH